MTSKPNSTKSSSFLIVIVLFFAVFTINGYSQQPSTKSVVSIEEATSLLTKWADGVIRIGEVFQRGGDYKNLASQLVDDTYDYQSAEVLFKPTLASETQFRLTREGAVSYFIGGNETFTEDKGFALKIWKSVRWEPAGWKVFDDATLVMGNYYFAHEIGGEETKVEFVFGIHRNKEGQPKIFLHSSHLPFVPKQAKHA